MNTFFRSLSIFLAALILLLAGAFVLTSGSDPEEAQVQGTSVETDEDDRTGDDDDEDEDEEDEVVPTTAASTTTERERVTTTTARSRSEIASERASQVDFGDVAAEVGSGVVKIDVVNCDASSATGSGLLVAPRLVLTASHVIETGRRIEVRASSGTRQAKVIGINRELDLALLSFGRELDGHKFLPAAGWLQAGTRVASLGFPGDAGLTRSEGEIRPVILTGDAEGNFAHSAVADFGGSGGPVIDTEGKVVGINLLGFDTDDLTIAAPAAVAWGQIQAWRTATGAITLCR